MFYVLVENVYVALAVSAATALHHLKLRPDLLFIVRANVIPRVRTVTVALEAGGSRACRTVEFVHLSRSLRPGLAEPKLLEADKTVTVPHNRVTFTEMLNQTLS